jgi:hypothetical protein
MAYTELHGGIQYHHKTARLAKLLKVNPREALGIRVALYAWAIDNRPGGIIEADLIPFACMWDTDEKPLMDALLQAGIIDPKEGPAHKIHDWEDYTKGYHKRRLDADRMSKLRTGTHEPVAKCSATVALQSPSVALQSPTVAVNGAERSGAERNGESTAVAEAPAAPPRFTGATSEDEIKRQLFDVAKRQKIAGRPDTLSTYLDAWASRLGGPGALLERLSHVNIRGKTIMEIQDMWFPKVPSKPAPLAQNGMSADAPKCGTCNDKKTIPVEWKDGKPVMGPCTSCTRRRTG